MDILFGVEPNAQQNFCEISSKEAYSKSSLLFSEYFADVVFLVGSEKIPAHKAIIGIKCEYFATMFKKESTNEVVEIKQFSATAFKSVLEYLYTGDLKAETEEDALEVLGLGRQYLLDGLIQLMENQIKTKLTLNNVSDIMQTAHDMKFDKVCQSCYQFLNSNLSSVIACIQNGRVKMIFDAWKYLLTIRMKIEPEKPIKNCNPVKNGRYSYAPKPLYTEPNDVNVEITVFRALLKWAQETSSDLKEQGIQDLFSKIRLNAIKLGDLMGEVRSSNVYDANVLLNAIEYKITPYYKECFNFL